MVRGIRRECLVPMFTVNNETSLAQHGTDQSKSCLCPETSLGVEEIKKTSLTQHGTDQSKSCLCPETSLNVEEIKKTSLAQHGTDQSKSCLCPETSLDVEEIKKTSLTQHGTDQSKSCLCPQTSLGVEEIKKKLMDCNRDLNDNDIFYSYKSNSEISESTRRQTEELEELIPCLLKPELLPYLQSFLVCEACSYVQLIFHHVLAKLDHPARENFSSADKSNYPVYIQIRCYFNLFYKDTNQEVAFDLIHKVWKNHPSIEFILRLLCCKRLLENKQYGILNHLIQYNEDYFLTALKQIGQDLRYFGVDSIFEYGAYLTVALFLLCNYMTSRQTENVETVLMIVKHISNFTTLNHLSIGKSCKYFMLLTLSLKQTRLIPSLIKVLLNRPELHYISSCIISLCNERLLEVDCHKMSMDFIKDNSHYILNVPFILETKTCDERQKYCKLVLTLLHAYVMCDDLTNMNYVLNRLHEFRQSLLSSTYKLCACFMGKQDCHANMRITSGCLLPRDGQDRKNMNRFKSSLFFLSLSINNIRNKVIKEELRPDCYLTQMVDAVEKYIDFREDLIEEFISFIEQISLHNENGLYDIIKSLCDLEMQPEIQDMFIQRLTDYILVTCHKLNSIYSRLLLDINMTCYKGEFLKKLTINMGQLLLLNVDTGNDVEKIIYRCFCKVRHENIDTDIAKYQVYFTFISTMDAEKKMLKMSNLRSFLLMLILMMISSGSQHKSAKLKKYLSLKYAYEDAILYLLWCSGDVEINPGPCPKLEKQAIAIKKRNWTIEMCTITLKLLKNKALDSQFNGLWIEKPDNWQELHAEKPFYNPRKKTGKPFNDETDKELLNCLLKCCDGKSITLPSNFQREIDAWKGKNVKLLLELFVTRKEIKSIKESIELLVMYRDTAELNQNMKNCNFSLAFSHVGRSKDYSDIMRKFAITFCRISKGLPILVKKDGMWKTPPNDWNPNDLYYDPGNTAKRHEKHQDQKLVDDLLFYCERKSIPIPSELQLVVEAWKQRDSQEICKHYTIWSSMAIIQHSLKYLELQGLLEKPHVQQSLKQIGVSLHCERDPKHVNSERTTNTDNEVSGLLNNSLSDNQRGTGSSSSDIVYSQHLYEAKALTSSQTMKSVIKCSKPDFKNQQSTSGCTNYSTLVPCPDSRGDLQSTDERLEFSDSHTILSEILYEGTDLQSSISSCTTYSKRAPCRENSGDIQYTDERLHKPDSHKCVSEILCQEPDFQPSSSGCSTFTNRAEYVNVRESVPPTERIQKRHRASSKDRSDKRPRLHSGNESQASTPITRCNGDTTPSSHCDLDNAVQNVHSSNTEEEVDQDLRSNRIPVLDNIQDTDSSNTQLSGDEITQHLLQYLVTYISCNNLEVYLEEDLEQITDSSNTQLSGSGDEIPQHLLQYLDNYISCNNLEDNLGEDWEQITDSSNTQLSGSGDEIPQHLLQYLDNYISCNNLEDNLGEDLEQIDVQLKLWDTS